MNNGKIEAGGDVGQISPFDSNIFFDEDQEGQWLKDHSFTQTRRGTFFSPESDSYYYHKIGFEVDSREKAESVLTLIKGLTELQILHPKTKVAGVKKQNGKYHIVAEMPKLHAITSNDLSNPSDELKEPMAGFYSLSRASAEFGGTQSLDKFEAAYAMLDHDTHLTSWVKRLYPNLKSEDTSPEALLATRMLNIFEASEFDNWGYDTELKMFFPVDFEVVKGIVDFNEDEINSSSSLIVSALSGVRS